MFKKKVYYENQVYILLLLNVTFFFIFCNNFTERQIEPFLLYNNTSNLLTVVHNPYTIYF